jgi:hypothetical protein
VVGNRTRAQAIQEAKPGDLILCRTNAPLANLAYSLLRAGIPTKIIGRDIGAGIKRLANKAMGKGAVTVGDTLN